MTDPQKKVYQGNQKTILFLLCGQTNENSKEKLLWKYIIYLYMGIFNDNSQNDHLGHLKF